MKALITGVNGQDGSYLAEFLLNKGYEVHGMVRRSSSFITEYIDHLFSNPRFHTHYGDLSDSSNLMMLIGNIVPDEIYNLGAQSHVAVSFNVPEYTADVDALGVLRLLNAILTINPDCKLYQASTSELFGGIPGTEPQSESTPFFPRSPYGVAKQYAFWIIKNYREAYGLNCVNGILFNHESPRRSLNFVTRKISWGVSRIYHNEMETLVLGNLDSIRDWGYAKEYVEAMWLMLNKNPKFEDLVISTGKGYKVRDFASLAFKRIGIEVEWVGEGVDEIGLDRKTGKCIVRIDPKYFRPTEVDVLIGNSTKAEHVLGWKPNTYIEDLVNIMVESDLKK